MSLKSLEAAILAELREVAKNAKIRQKDILEWSTSEVEARTGETLYFMPKLGIHAAVKLPEKKAKKK
jgi:hypothetical protein